MRFYSAAAFGALSMALFAPAVLACERECQVNVSRAFADKYEILSDQYFTLLNQKVEESFFYGISANPLTPGKSADVLKTMKDSITGAQEAWSKTIFQTVFDTIFKDEPKFKGDCNFPHRVNQPPRGVNWTMPDCHNMDYICGNPPSICHFMPMIKTRIVKKLTAQLQERLDGDDSDVYVSFIGPALQTVLAAEPGLSGHLKTLHANLNQILESVKGELEKFANEDNWKSEWDMEIKWLLLTFP
ncbi:hypothetical protein BGZ72_005555 [Mortierella alpina]|nr:hypothetical protein BGZ72_005555 [Mortierella alpina]